MNKLPNIHPGEVLLEEFLRPLRISQHRLARDIGVPPAIRTAWAILVELLRQA